MPLPLDNAGFWPPLDIRPYIDQAEAAAAWWSGDRDDLAATSHSTGTGASRRKFWQRRKTGDATTTTHHVHAPLAGDIAAVSAELLYGDFPNLVTDDTAAQAQLEETVETIGLQNLMLEAAEVAAATGGVYLRQTWDTRVADHPLMQSFPQTNAVPDFRYGRLFGVSMWEEVDRVGGTIWRHLERHEPGRVLHGLYVGSEVNLGTSIPLTELPATADYQPEVLLPGRLRDRMLVQYVPNALPNRKLKSRPLGRADWVGCEDFLDALDETWTSLMRDIRIGQARILLPEEWVTKGGRPGTQSTFDVDDEAFIKLHVAQSEQQKLETFQPDLRIDQHLAGTVALMERIVSACGYSPQTFGMDIKGSAHSGTALRIREGKTKNTMVKKQGYHTPGLQQAVVNLLDIGYEVWGTPTIADPKKNPAKVGWAAISMDPAENATMIQTLRTAEAISIRTAVKMAQPDLDEDDVDEEVALIQSETAMASPTDPFHPATPGMEPPVAPIDEAPPHDPATATDLTPDDQPAVP